MVSPGEGTKNIIATRIWEYLRKSVKLTYTDNVTKAEVVSAVEDRKSAILQALREKKKVGGITYDRARVEREDINRILGQLKSDKLEDLHTKIREISGMKQRSSTGREYFRSYRRWSDDEKHFMVKNIGLDTKRMRKAMERRFERIGFTLDSVSRMASRIKKRVLKREELKKVKKPNIDNLGAKR